MKNSCSLPGKVAAEQTKSINDWGQGGKRGGGRMWLREKRLHLGFGRICLFFIAPHARLRLIRTSAAGRLRARFPPEAGSSSHHFQRTIATLSFSKKEAPRGQAHLCFS